MRYPDPSCDHSNRLRGFTDDGEAGLYLRESRRATMQDLRAPANLFLC